MLLSVFVYRHKLTTGQWAGAAVVFAGIAVEAYIKRRGSLLGSCFANQATDNMFFHRCACKTGDTGEREGKD